MRGRPKRQWMDDIEEWSGCSYIQLKEMSQDREQWRWKTIEWSSAVANRHWRWSTSEWVSDTQVWRSFFEINILTLSLRKVHWKYKTHCIQQHVLRLLPRFNFLTFWNFSFDILHLGYKKKKLKQWQTGYSPIDHLYVDGKYFQFCKLYQNWLRDFGDVGPKFTLSFCRWLYNVHKTWRTAIQTSSLLSRSYDTALH